MCLEEKVPWRKLCSLLGTLLLIAFPLLCVSLLIGPGNKGPVWSNISIVTCIKVECLYPDCIGLTSAMSLAVCVALGNVLHPSAQLPHSWLMWGLNGLHRKVLASEDYISLPLLLEVVAVVVVVAVAVFGQEGLLVTRPCAVGKQAKQKGTNSSWGSNGCEAPFAEHCFQHI